MMSWTDSLIFAATLAVVCSIGIEKIMVMDWDFTELLPSNRRRAKMNASWNRDQHLCTRRTYLMIYGNR